MAIDAAGRVWFTGRGQAGTIPVYRLDPATDTVKIFNAADGTRAINTVGGIAIDQAGNLWMTLSDQGSGLLQDINGPLIQMSPEGEVLTNVHNARPRKPDPCPHHPCAENPFVGGPVGVILEGSGGIWVPNWPASTTPFRATPGHISRFTASGGFLQAVPFENRSQILSAAVDGDGALWALTESARLMKVSASGSLIKTIPLPAEATAVSWANSIEVDREGNVWILFPEYRTSPAHEADDTGHGGSGLLKYSPAGDLLGTFPLPNATRGYYTEWDRADGMAIDSAGVLWLIDGFHHELLGLDTQGNVLQRLTDVPGNYALGARRPIAIDGDGSIWLFGTDWRDGHVAFAVEAVGVATGPQYFAAAGPQFPY